MISLQSPDEILRVEERVSKKRKWDDPTEAISGKSEKFKSIKSDFETNLRTETPLPIEWQRCLDIKSGQLYFYNTRTQKRALGDPRSSQETFNQAPMSLELELNLSCQSLKKNHVQNNNGTNHDSYTNSAYSGNNQFMNPSIKSKDGKSSLKRSPSWLTVEGEQQEMVTAVCKKCYMLVMMCKSSPACPNCKFVHPPDPNSNMFNQSLSLLC